MKTTRGIAVLLFALISAAAVLGQDTAKIPRRVFFTPAAAESLKKLPPDQAALLGNIPYFLFSAVTNIRPIILVDKPEPAQSSVDTEFVEKEDHILVSCVLREKETVQKQESFPYRPGTTSLAELTEGIRKTAASFAPLLSEVPPEVSVESKLQEERQNKIIREASFADSLAKPFQITLWTLGFLQFVTADLPSENFASEFNMPYPTHFALDLGWYRTPNFGLLASLYLDYNETMYFGSFDMDMAGDKEIMYFTDTENLFTLVGLGVSYRTLGKIAGEFNILLYMGSVLVTAKENMYYLYGDDYTDILSLQSGQSKSFFFTFLSFQPCLAFNFNERFSVKARVSMNIDPRIFGNSEFSAYSYNRYSNFMFMYLGEIGAAIRF